MDEFNSVSSTREVIKDKLRQCFDGRIVRKDLTKSIKEGANVPVYVLEFLLGQYCSSDDPDVIEAGVANVKRFCPITMCAQMRLRKYCLCFGSVVHTLLLTKSQST